jgi:hypothetical protein
MFFSRNSFFKQPQVVLLNKLSKVVTLLKIKEVPEKEINNYVKAYRYFCKNTKDFDGATIVKDLDDIPNLDLNAMLHDYRYLVENASLNFISKWEADIEYLEGMARLGKGYRTGRFISLFFIGIIWVPYKNIVKKR